MLPHSRSGRLTAVVDAVIVDPVDHHWERDLRHLERLELKLAWMLETHAHRTTSPQPGELREVASGCGIKGSVPWLPNRPREGRPGVVVATAMAPSMSKHGQG